MSWLYTPTPCRAAREGRGFPPGCPAHGSVRFAPCTLTVFPNGAEKYIAVPASIIARSPYISYAVFCLKKKIPSGSQASPTLGKNLSHTGQLMYSPLVYY